MNVVIKTVVRTLLTVTSRETAERRTRQLLDDYLELARSIRPEEGMKSVRVPPMRGVDEDMRDWSLYMVLEHNAIVNDIMSDRVQRLAHGESPDSATKIDPKKDVMPSASPGEEQVERFQRSVENHLLAVKELGKLRGTDTSEHPIFGTFNAHKWNNMFWFHLKVHYNQAAYVCREATQKDVSVS